MYNKYFLAEAQHKGSLFFWMGGALHKKKSISSLRPSASASSSSMCSRSSALLTPQP
jgi:hypothetical protein